MREMFSARVERLGALQKEIAAEVAQHQRVLQREGQPVVGQTLHLLDNGATQDLLSAHSRSPSAGVGLGLLQDDLPQSRILVEDPGDLLQFLAVPVLGLVQ